MSHIKHFNDSFSANSDELLPVQSWDMPIRQPIHEVAYHRRRLCLPADADRGVAAIDILWSMVSGPTFDAWLELAVAGRTDPELRARVVALGERFVRGPRRRCVIAVIVELDRLLCAIRATAQPQQHDPLT